MKVSIKIWAVALLVALCVLSSATHSNGACNLANGIKKASFVFLKSDDSSYETKYGYDTDASGGSHVSIAKGETTYVTIMYDRDSDGEYETLTNNDYGNYGLELVSDDGVTAELKTGDSFDAETGRFMRIIGGDTTGTFTVKISPESEDKGTGICGELTVHVYNKKTVSKLHMYIESGVTKSYSGFESTVNPVIKPAVMELTAITVHLDHNFEYDPTSYGGNNNGSFDTFRDGGGSGPEKTALITYLSSITETPKVCIMKESMHALRLTASAAAGANVLFVSDPEGLLCNGKEGVIVGCANAEQPGLIASVVGTVGATKRITFQNNFSSSHGTGYSDGVYFRGAVSYPNTVAITGSNLGDEFVVHEVLHLTEFGALSDISPDASGVGENVMKGTNMGLGGLRYRTLSGEIQWDKVHQ